MYTAAGVLTQDRGDHVIEARLYVRDVTRTCFRRRYTLFAENRVAIVTEDVQLHHSTSHRPHAVHRCGLLLQMPHVS